MVLGPKCDAERCDAVPKSLKMLLIDDHAPIGMSATASLDGDSSPQAIYPDQHRHRIDMEFLLDRSVEKR